MRLSGGKIVLAAMVLSSFASVTGLQLYGPEGSFSSSFGGRLEYDPTDGCYKPMRPIGNDKWAWDNYANDGQRYLSCLRSNSEADIKYAQRVVQEGYDEAVEDYMREVEYGY